MENEIKGRLINSIKSDAVNVVDTLTAFRNDDEQTQYCNNEIDFVLELVNGFIDGLTNYNEEKIDE